MIGAAVLVLAACDSGETDLSTESTIITGGSNATPTTSTSEATGTTSGVSSPTTLVGQTVADFTVVARFGNDNGEERWYVIPNAAYTDVDLENFVVDLIESDPQLYGAEIFDDEAAVEAYQVDADSRTEEQNALIERHHFVTLIGRDRIEFKGPFAEFSGGAIGS